MSPSQRLDVARKRANAYLAAGADCAFVPFLSDAATIAELVQSVSGPLNILGTPAAPLVPQLERLGVRRVSVGSGFARAAWGHALSAAEELLRDGTYGGILTRAIPYAEMQRLFGAE